MRRTNRASRATRCVAAAAAAGIAVIAVSSPAGAQVLRPGELLRQLPPAAKERFRESQPYDFADREGYVALFDGRTLNGWDGDPAVWRVENGLLVGERPGGATQNNDYIVHRGTTTRDFDLKVEIRVVSGGSGIQYRSRTGEPWLYPVANAPAPKLKWMMTGPQADLWAAVPAAPTVFDGQVFIENSRRAIVAYRGEVSQARPGGQRVVGNIDDPVRLSGFVSSQWNAYHIIARGGVVMHIINGQLMAVHIDDDPASPDNRAGLIGLEAELNPARIEVRNIWLKRLD